MLSDMADKMRLTWERLQALRSENLYHNLYHRWPALAGAHERKIGENPLIPALTSAHERSTHI